MARATGSVLTCKSKKISSIGYLNGWCLAALLRSRLSIAVIARIVQTTCTKLLTMKMKLPIFNCVKPVSCMPSKSPPLSDEGRNIFHHQAVFRIAGKFRAFSTPIDEDELIKKDLEKTVEYDESDE